ncbi:MAG: hypothetical protein NVS9B8_15660 [Candidatus Limnocylindrales bacterium]
MARAKRTDRAEARRRYRASNEDPPTAGQRGGDDPTLAPEAAAPERRPIRSSVMSKDAVGAGAATAGTPRPSIVTAFRSAFRPVDLRGDIRALPRIVTHWSFLVPVVLSGLSVALIPLVGLNAMTSAFYQYFSFTAPLGTSFIAGVFAPRASYLVGILTALASVGFQAIAFNVGPFAGLLDGFRDTNGALLTQDAARQLVLSQALLTGVPSGALFAAAAAWYRRFLNRANPNRSRASRPSGPPGRRSDGKVPKKPQQRPMLARRR